LAWCPCLLANAAAHMKKGIKNGGDSPEWTGLSNPLLIGGILDGANGTVKPYPRADSGLNAGVMSSSDEERSFASLRMFNERGVPTCAGDSFRGALPLPSAR
jgi:hypothetical protein